WEFPCMTPSDWQAQHRHKPNNPQTVADWRAALDCTVKKQGVFPLVLHPHGWVKSEHIVDFIDYAVKKHRKKVKFLTFNEALERISRHVTAGPLRDQSGRERGVMMLDVNNDAHVDALIGIGHSDGLGTGQTRLWSSAKRTWAEAEFPEAFFAWLLGDAGP